jgi:(E)-4-hydroxy-3-methylbut-2-enyl-diphosphate synthase
MSSEKQITVGGVPIGGGAPVVVQSMTTTETADVGATLAQARALAEAGCDLVRVAVPGRADADALPAIVAGSPLPVIADIHFNASLALRAMDAGVAAVRINPGNIGGDDKVGQVVHAAKAAGIPMRIGANSGSLPDHLRQFATSDPAGALVEAALEEVRLLEKLAYRDFKISVKSSSVPVMIQAYQRLSARVPYPLHLGVTEAGPVFTGTVKSSVGIGTLLSQGIGDTLRVSLTADPVEEVKVAWEILRSLGLRHKGPMMIACPSCGRTNVDVLALAEQVEARLGTYPQVFEVAVMGCAVNGPGEAGDADFGIAAASTPTARCCARCASRSSWTSCSARSTPGSRPAWCGRNGARASTCCRSSRPARSSRGAPAPRSTRRSGRACRGTARSARCRTRPTRRGSGCRSRCAGRTSAWLA